jgi:2-polyprenyl-6-methoxyphenol hydroxylase-like FAD-dependent oxidoreductase
VNPQVILSEFINKPVGWNEGGSKENLETIYMDFEPRARAILNHVDPESLKVWTLLDMEKLPTWINGKLGLIGDAAHPFLPRKRIL